MLNTSGIKIEPKDIRPGDNIRLCVTVDGEFVPVERFILNAFSNSCGSRIPLCSEDVFFFFPAVNQSLAFIAGIEEEMNQRNLICVAAAIRGLVDTTMSLYYALTVDSSDMDGFIKAFGETGELTKPGRNGRRSRVTGKELVNRFKETGFDGSQTYQNLSKCLHFTRIAMDAMISETNDDDMSFKFAVLGAKTKYPEKLWNEVTGVVSICISVLIAIIDQWAFKNSHTIGEENTNAD